MAFSTPVRKLQPLLDDATAVQRGNVSNYGASIMNLPAQIQHAWLTARALRLPAAYRRATVAVACGMGGSSLGTDILRTVFRRELRRPLVLRNDYTLPGFVGPKTLLLASSYSGSTEEVLAALGAARRRRAKIAVVSGGGPLASAAQRLRLPIFRFTPTHNPSGQPRLGLGYLLVGQWRLLGQANVVPETAKLMATFQAAVTAATARFSPTVPTRRNPAKRLALSIYGRVPLIITAELLAGNAHAFANQCHESAKHLALTFSLPELNHHLLEGISLPAATRSLIGVLLASPSDPPRIQQRLRITRTVLQRQHLPTFSYRARPDSPIAQAGEILQLGACASWYLAVLNRVNPQAIPWVDFFKAQLARSR